VKIATQNLLLIVPIFLLLAIITSVLVFFSEQREVRWGIESEAEGLALTIAEFTDLPSLASSMPGDGAADDSAKVPKPLERVLAFGQARRIDIAAFQGTRLQPVVGAGEGSAVTPVIDDETRGRLAQGQIVTQDVARAEWLVAHAPVRDAAGALRGVVSVATSLAPVAAHRTAVLRRTAAILLALLLVGGLVSLVISTLITSEIAHLTQTASAFAAGDYDAALAPGAIEEVAVVGATFGIMGSVLKDATVRSTRQMLQFDRFNTEGTLAKFHAERFSMPVAAEHAGVRVAIDRLGPAVHGDFWFVEGDARRARACLGRVDGPASFDLALAGSAVNTLLQELFAHGKDAAAALGDAASLFPIHCCVLVEWQADAHGELMVHRLGQDGTIANQILRLHPGRTAALTTLEQSADRQALRYAHAHEFDTPRRLVNELRRLFGAGTQGGVLALQVTL
jgi:HAMP domain-containing protein